MKIFLISLLLLSGACDDGQVDFEVVEAPLATKGSMVLQLSTQGGGVYREKDYWEIARYQNEWCHKGAVGEAYAVITPDLLQECVVCRTMREVCEYRGGCDYTPSSTTVAVRQFCSNKSCILGMCELPYRR